MDKLSIVGNGPLRGDVYIPGAKNAALPVLVAGLLTAEPLEVSHLPGMIDISTMLELLRQLGATVESSGSDASIAHSGSDLALEASRQNVRAMRASILLLGPLLARFGEAELPLPGGCAIGSRPVNLHLEGLRAMGAEISIENDAIVGRARRLKGAEIHLAPVSVTGTENLMMAATLAEGRTVINNAAREPEVVDLAKCLIAMGARVSGAGTDRIVVEGVSALHGATHRIVPDRIETGTYLVAAAATCGRVTTYSTAPEYLSAVLERLCRTGAAISTGNDWVRVDMRGHRPRAVDITTGPFPAFPTDMQAQFVALNAVASGSASVTETIFENRFRHVRELKRMGARIDQNLRTVSIDGTRRLFGTQVVATDLRASAGLVIAALCAEGETTIHRIYHLDRGYANLDGNMMNLGAIVRRGAAEGEIPANYATISQATAGA